MKFYTSLKALVAFLCLGTSVLAQNVFIPDPNFKSALVSNPQINTNGDGEIQASEASSYTGTIDAQSRNIEDLTGIEAFTVVTRLYVNNNRLSSVDLSANRQLVILRVNHNMLTSLDVSNNTKLVQLHCYVNQLSSLDVSALASLEVLFAFQNNLTSLYLQLNRKLRELNVAYNQLRTLDLRDNSMLTYVDVKSNSLEYILLQNGTNTNITYFNALRNVNLLCIEVDNNEYSEANWKNVEPWSHFSYNCAGDLEDIVFFEDENLEAALVANRDINTNGDRWIQGLEARTFGGSIFVPNKNIQFLTGIERFTNLRELHVYENNIEWFDLRQNVELLVLRINDNPMTAIDVSKNTKLTKLLAHNTLIGSLDLSANTALQTLWAFGCELTSLNLSNNEALVDVQVNHNQLTSLTLGNHPSLKTLFAYSNQLTSIDVSGAPALDELRLQQNGLTSVNIGIQSSLRQLNVGDNMITSISLTGKPQLRVVEVYNNKLTKLDLSTNPNLTYVTAYKNNLTELNVRNGNNTKIREFDATRNPNLLCIQVDDPAWSEANWTKVDPQTEFKTDCGFTGPDVVNIPDPAFLQRLIELGVDTNTDGKIQYTEAAAFTNEMMLVGAGIKDPTGVEAFTGVTRMTWEHNDITWLDVRQCTSLNYLSSGYTKITSLHVNPQLEVLECYFSPLTTLTTLQNNTNLRYIDWSGTNLQSFDLDDYPFASKLKFFAGSSTEMRMLDLGAAVNLEFFGLSDTPLAMVDLSASTHLTHIRMHSNLNLEVLNIKNGNNTNIIEFNLQNHPRLTCVEVDDVAYAEENFEVESHTRFSEDCDGSEAIVNVPDPIFKQYLVSNSAINTNGDTEIQVTEAKAYTDVINVYGRGISDLTGIEAFVSISGLDASENNLASLNLGDNNSIIWLYARNNNIRAFSIWDCANLKQVDVQGNEMESIIIPPGLEVLNASQNLIRTINIETAAGLYDVNLSNNRLTEVDLKDNLEMKVLNVENNMLTWLNIPLAHEGGLTELEAMNNDLTCIQVDNPEYAEANWRDDVDAEATFSTHCEGDPSIVYIPDPKLKELLLMNVDGYPYGPEDEKDGEVQYDEAASLSGGLDFAGQGITDLTGMHAFGNVEVLNVDNNQITQLKDIGGSMTTLYIRNNGLKEIAVSIDHVQYLLASNNELTSLPSMKSIFYLDVENNNLTSLGEGWEDTPFIQELIAGNNQISSIVEENLTEVVELILNDNQLTELDMSGDTFLSVLDVTNNKLTSLNVKNGNNTSMSLEAMGNPNLTCIEVDDPAWAEANWRDDVDPQATFSEDCDAGGAGLRIAVSPNPTMGKLSIESSGTIDEVQIYDGLSGGLVSREQGSELDISHLRNGLYLIKVRSGENVMTTRIVKE